MCLIILNQMMTCCCEPWNQGIIYSYEEKDKLFLTCTYKKLFDNPKTEKKITVSAGITLYITSYECFNTLCSKACDTC